MFFLFKKQKNLAEEVRVSLPPSIKYQPGYESTYYGASRIVATALRLTHVNPDACFHWTHGCYYNGPYFVECLARYPNLGGNYLVSTQEQVEFLRGAGFANAFAVGNPIVYAPTCKVKRRKRALLVMPPHLTLQTKMTFNEDEYVQYIESIAGHFDDVVICVSLTCWEYGGWVKAFKKIGLSCIPGAGIDDANALRRMRAVFEQFEHVTTNTIGSHIAYGSAFGCKVSIAGPRMGFHRDVAKDAPFYVDHPHLLEAFSEDELARGIREQRCQLFCEPTEACDNTDWGRARIGWDRRVSFEELASFLWKPETLQQIRRP